VYAVNLAAMFEAKCNKMSAFEQNDANDEDLWEDKEVIFSPAAADIIAPPVYVVSVLCNCVSCCANYKGKL